MARFRSYRRVILASVICCCLAITAVLMAQRQPESKTQGKAASGAAAQGMTSAQEMSAAFRRAAHETLPGIVSIETRERAPAWRRPGRESAPEPFGDNSPFGDFFRSEPGLRDFFRNLPRSPMPRIEAKGSGFVFDRSGLILTNNHVVRNAEQVTVRLSDGREFIATDVRGDSRTDIAIVRIKPEGELHPLRLGNSDTMDIGDWVLAVGSPFGLDLSVTAGIISAKGRGPGITEREDFLQTDAAINPGNSGGPLINLNGEVIGINTAISSRTGGYEGVGFAIPINLAHWVADQLAAKGTVSRAFLGVAVQAIDQELSRQFKVPLGHGALVTQVNPDSPAAGAKLEAGDVILRLDGKPVDSPRTLQGIVEQLQIGQKYPLIIWRNGKESTLHVEVREMPRDYSLTPELDAQGPSSTAPGKFSELGVEIEELTPEIARQLGYKEATGVVITAIQHDGPAAQAGLQEGMLIEKVGDQRVGSATEFKEAMQKVSLEKGILLLVRSSKGAHFVVIRKSPA